MGKSPATDRAAELTALIEKNAEKKCIEFFADMPEAERRELAPVAIPAFKKALKGSWAECEAARIAALATASLSELKSLRWRVVPITKNAFEILAARKPDWLSEYADWLIGENPFDWPLVRALMRRGLCRRPQHENYTLGMITMLDNWRLEGRFVKPPAKSVVGNLRADPELLAGDLWEIFRVEGQGEHTLAAHDKYNKGSEFGWAGALVALSKTGELPRDRLLDESLEALNRGFSQFRVAWFSQFHELLEPTVKERVERLDKYLVLLASPIPPTVTFALDALEVIDKERKLKADELLEPLSPVLMARHKGTAVRAVQWLARLAERDEKRRGDAVRAIAGALAHEAADVQKAALAAIEKYGLPDDAKLCDALAAAEKHVAASLRKRVAAWARPSVAPRPEASSRSERRQTSNLDSLAAEAAKLPARWRKLAGLDALLAAAKSGRSAIAAIEFGPLDVPRLDPAMKIEPLTDLDAWIDACAHFLENRDLVDEGERVLDGVSRLCGDVPADFDRRIGPLAKRVETLYRRGCLPFVGFGLWHDVIGVVRAWVSGKVIQFVRKRNERGTPYWAAEDRDKPLYFANVDDPASLALSKRSLAVAQRVAERSARPLPSAPTHRGGWLDPAALVERLAAWEAFGDEPPIIESVLALLRLAPDNRSSALKGTTKLSGEVAEAIRYALGAEKVKVGRSAPLWIAAARARDPLADDPRIEKRFPTLGPDAGMAARYGWKWQAETHRFDGQTYTFHRLLVTTTPHAAKKLDHELIPVLVHHHSREIAEGHAVDDVRWSASWWPAGREAQFAAGARRLGNNLDWSSAYWANKAYLEPLLDPDTPLGEMATLVLCLGLSAKEPGEHTLAADALAAAISDGRVDGNCLAPTLAKLLTTAGIKPARWAKVLADVARISPLHHLIVRTTLENTLAAAAKLLVEPPKDLHLLLDLLLELLAERGEAVSSEPLRAALAKTSGATKVAKAAKALLALAPSGGGQQAEATQAAIQQRIARARRWQQRSFD
jgi:hypothetical protein